jgi:transposase
VLKGPSFEYEHVRALVPARVGIGPVWVAWDTNILSLYERYGLAMWDRDNVEVTGTDPEEVDALSTLIFVWLWWDLRFIVLDATATDHKKPRKPDLVERRRRVSSGLVDALSLGLDGEGGSPESRVPYIPAQVMDSLPHGHDRVMVREAFEIGADVFLTIDKGILKRAATLRYQGLVCMSPKMLIEALVEAGLDVTSGPRELGSWPIPDLGRMSALIGALME